MPSPEVSSKRDVANQEHPKSDLHPDGYARRVRKVARKQILAGLLLSSHYITLVPVIIGVHAGRSVVGTSAVNTDAPRH